MGMNKKVKVTLPDAVIARRNFDVDRYHGIIVAADSETDPNVPAALNRGDYADLIQWQDGDITRVTSVNRICWDLGAFEQYDIWASQMPVSGSSCEDIPMIDENSNTCADYSKAGEEWCLRSGYVSDSGIARWPEACTNDDPDRTPNRQCRMPAGNDTSTTPPTKYTRDAAGVLCCACGGGRWTPPEGFEPGTQKQITA